ncbi:MAG: IS3 family transposase, partial [Nitrospirae bacterium]|nr:IS3 family transposase [Nitrospirota bacterium]
LIDEQYTKPPFYGSRRMVVTLRGIGHEVNRKRIQRLMRVMGIEAIYPKPMLSKANPEHKIYPYLLRDLEINRNNHVWGTDITYIRLAKGWVYLVAIMDWFSRYVLSWELSTSLEADFCVSALEQAFTIGMPEIFNSDQGSQFTSTEFVSYLEHNGVQVSMDGKGRATDNIFTERLWRSLKYEEVYLRDYRDVRESRSGTSITMRDHINRWATEHRRTCTMAAITKTAVVMAGKRTKDLGLHPPLWGLGYEKYKDLL